MKLNLGSGPNELAGFVNLDRINRWRFEDGLPYPAGSVEAITISHVLMYVDELDWPFVFAEIARVLEDGGVVRITEDSCVDPLSERYGGHVEAVTLTSPAKVIGYLESVGLWAIDRLPWTTGFRDDSLIQRYHGEPPKVFHVEATKGERVKIDVVYVAWNRLQFTEKTFELLLENTDWDLVRKLHVYDDGSSDGTVDLLAEQIARCPTDHELHATDAIGPVGVMNRYLAEHADGSDLFAKIDNDIGLPSGWLNEAARVMICDGELELLGLAAGWPDDWTEDDAIRGWSAATHIGGVGLMRTKAFAGKLPIYASGRQGFTQWQEHYQPVRGWIVPDVKAAQLDLIPAEPWAELAAGYVKAGLAREWPPYGNPELWAWIT